MNDTQSLLNLLTADALEERCGFVLKDGSIVEVANVHADPTCGFYMASVDLKAYAPDAKATWHTHPSAGPNLSQEDYAGFLNWPSLEHHIIGRGAAGPELRSFAVIAGVVVQL